MQTSTIAIYPADKKVIPIMPYAVKGKYRDIKTVILMLAYTVYFGMPWMVWHGSQRVGQPLLFDIANERFYLFDLVVYPQDLMLLVAAMIMAACLLFIVATFYGRIFCGFFCFQTIWTDAFRIIEAWVQGEAQARQRLMKQPWHLEKIAKLLTTYCLWFLLSLATAVTFSLYFATAPKLFAELLTGQAAIAAYITVITLTLTTYFAAGIAKEDICRVACPYGKFQSVMQDPMTKTVNYDQSRGERQKGRIAPNKSLKNASERNNLGYGDCTDCGYCVNVCPTGVDIRQGFQIDCISCGLCIDACDSIMQAVKLPTGLIRFDRIESKQTVAADFRFINQVKKLGYMTLLVLSASFIGYQIQNMTPYTVSIQQQAQPLVTRLSDGTFKSRYIVRISNKTDSGEIYEIKTLGLPKNVKLMNDTFEVPAGKSYVHTVDMILNEEDAEKLRSFKVMINPKSSPNATTQVDLGYNFKL